MNVIQVIQQSPDKMGRTVWKFRVDNCRVYLIYWANQTRPSYRHKWRTMGKHFDAYSRDDHDPAIAPVVHDPVWQEFKDEYMRSLTFAGIMGAGDKRNQI